MRIGLVLDSFPEVSETFLIHHVAALIDGGHDVTIFAQPAPPLPVHQAVARYGMLERTRFLPGQRRGIRQAVEVPRTLLTSWHVRGLTACLNLARYGTGVLRFRALAGLRQFHMAEFDLLHCHFASIGWAFLPLRDVFGVPLVTSFHGDHYKSFGRDGRGHLGRLFQLGDAFIANSRFTAAELRHLGCPDEKVHVIPAVVSDEDVEFRARAAGTPGPDGAIRILCVARLDFAKGIHVAIDAVATLRAAGHNVTLTVVGDGPYRDALATQITALGLGDSVALLGWKIQREVYEQYRQADLVVLPSVGDATGTNEAQGVVLQEAMLHGVPVIGSAIGGIPESVAGGDAGLLCEPGNADSLAAAILTAASDPQATLGRVDTAVHRVRHRYLKQPVLRAHESVYASALEHYQRTVRTPHTARRKTA
jgi:glycosyltransferase involved in cell wall biosynthesis